MEMSLQSCSYFCGTRCRCGTIRKFCKNKVYKHNLLWCSYPFIFIFMEDYIHFVKCTTIIIYIAYCFIASIEATASITAVEAINQFWLLAVIFSLTIIDIVQFLLLTIIVRSVPYSDNHHLSQHFYSHIRTVWHV